MWLSDLLWLVFHKGVSWALYYSQCILHLFEIALGYIGLSYRLYGHYTQLYVTQGSHSLEKSLNFRVNPWKVVEFLDKVLKSPWIFANIDSEEYQEHIFCDTVQFPQENI